MMDRLVKGNSRAVKGPHRLVIGRRNRVDLQQPAGVGALLSRAESSPPAHFFLWLGARAIVRYYFYVTNGERTFKDQMAGPSQGSAGAGAQAVIIATAPAADEGR
jgi:hypothetical protein